MRNEVHRLVRQGRYLSLCGADVVWVGRPNLDQVLRDLPETGAAILLSHEPDFADAAASALPLPAGDYHHNPISP